MHGDEQRQFQISKKRDEARHIHLGQHRDQWNHHQPNHAKAVCRVLARGFGQQSLGVLGHWIRGRELGAGRRAVALAGGAGWSVEAVDGRGRFIIRLRGDGCGLGLAIAGAGGLGTAGLVRAF